MPSSYVVFDTVLKFLFFMLWPKKLANDFLKCDMLKNSLD